MRRSFHITSGPDLDDLVESLKQRGRKLVAFKLSEYDPVSFQDMGVTIKEEVYVTKMEGDNPDPRSWWLTFRSPSRGTSFSGHYTTEGIGGRVTESRDRSLTAADIDQMAWQDRNTD